MVTINIREYAPHCMSNEDGQIIFDLVSPYLADNKLVTISFDGVPSTTSSFLNTSFIALVDKYGIEPVKKYVKIVDSNTHINRMIKDRISSRTTH